TCHGIITGGGFETPAEALYLQKRLMSIPIRGQYEQRCNAAALQQMGITVLQDADTDYFSNDIEQWLNASQPAIQQKAADIESILFKVVNMTRKNAMLSVA
ncbi:MAG TPA: glycosyltransferase family protein, partial [Phnomibacter sp.]|nr:glycosyltransferase family protein [Phnomibacter sp.]